jgi:hypothetical protein
MHVRVCVLGFVVSLSLLSFFTLLDPNEQVLILIFSCEPRKTPPSLPPLTLPPPPHVLFLLFLLLLLLFLPPSLPLASSPAACHVRVGEEETMKKQIL